MKLSGFISTGQSKRIIMVVCCCLLFHSSEAQKKSKVKKDSVVVAPEAPFPQEAKHDSIAAKIDTASISIPDTGTAKQRKKFMTGADQVKAYMTFLKGKKVAVVVNQTSIIGNTTLIDTLLKLKVSVVTIFTPEHGLKGKEPAGKKNYNSIDEETNLPVLSLYGDHLKPTKKEMADIDIVLFDIQDVGARFYTYISTLHYVMEACAEAQKMIIVLDRPNPNGFYVDGPMLNTKFRSFVGMDPIPVAYGMTVGELANMMNVEGWIKGGPCHLRVIKMKNYSHKNHYQLPVWTSPNLTDMKAVYLYPSLCLFEGTKVSVGRGTDRPFQQIGYPDYQNGDVTFTPTSMEAAPEPMYRDTLCAGLDLAHFTTDTANLPAQINISWLLQMYESYPDKKKFFTPFFDKLAGNSLLREQIQKGATEEEIRESWQEDLKKFMAVRKKYLLYDDFGEKAKGKKGTAKAARTEPVQKSTPVKGKKK
jgi:uncharacterized protein YbbC (DUF1343 family)